MPSRLGCERTLGRLLERARAASMRRRAKRIALITVFAACATLAACATGGGQAASSPPDPSSIPSDDSSEPLEDLDMTPLRIIVGDRVLEGRLLDNPAARSLLDQLPLTLDFSDYGGQEVLAEPPLPLTMEGMPSGESAPAGTIGYYAPSRALVLYYSDVPRFTGIVRIGEIDGDLSVLRGWIGARPVTIELVTG